MGCSNSKDTQTSKQGREPAPKPKAAEEPKAAPKKEETQQQEQKQEPEQEQEQKSETCTREEALKLIQTELNYDDKTNEKILARVNKDGDDKYDEKQLRDFIKLITEAHEKLRNVFEAADENNTGTVTLTEASNKLQERLPNMSEKTIKKCLYKMDSGDGIIQYKEFVLFSATLRMSRLKLISAFEKLDKDDDGKVPRAKVKEMLKEESTLDEEICDAMFEGDQDNDGSFSQAEFNELMAVLGD